MNSMFSPRHFSYEELVAAKERAHALRSQAISWAINDVVAGAIAKSFDALKRGSLSLLRPAETRQC